MDNLKPCPFCGGEAKLLNRKSAKVCSDDEAVKLWIDQAFKRGGSLMDNLKPCPFCGGEAKLLNRKQYGNITGSYVECKNCHISTKIVAVSAKVCSDDEAVKLWNDRYSQIDEPWGACVRCGTCIHAENLMNVPVGFTCSHCSRFYIDRYEEDKE